MDTVEKHLREYPECKVYLSTPPVIPGLGSSGGFEMQLEARGEATFDNLVDAADTLMYYASKRKELAGLSSSLQSEIPQLYFDVDRDKVKMLGVPLADVFSTMKAYTGSVYVNDFNMFNRIYKGLHSGGSSLPGTQRQYQSVLREGLQWSDGTVDFFRKCLLYHRTGKY